MMNTIYATLAIGGAMACAGCLAVVLGSVLGEKIADRQIRKHQKTLIS